MRNRVRADDRALFEKLRKQFEKLAEDEKSAYRFPEESKEEYADLRRAAAKCLAAVELYGFGSPEVSAVLGLFELGFKERDKKYRSKK